MKVVEIELCFQKTKMNLFDWLTKHNVLARKYNSTYIYVGLIIIGYFLLFFVGFIYTLSHKDQFARDIEKTELALQFNFSIWNVVVVANWVMLGIIIGSIIILLLRFAVVKRKLKRLEDYLSKN